MRRQCLPFGAFLMVRVVLLLLLSIYFFACLFTTNKIKHRLKNLISVALITYHDKSSLKEKGFILDDYSRLQAVFVIRSQCQELEIAGHLTSIVKEQRGRKYCTHASTISMSRIHSKAQPMTW